MAFETPLPDVLEMKWKHVQWEHEQSLLRYMLFKEKKCIQDKDCFKKKF